jgi:flagellar basal body rod protein FlgB|tara:strand:- start:105 stop:368 length:264 start_codon:yes stop_codon:yes gene_type:complete
MSIVKIDMAVAKEIHKNNIRNARTPKLAELDIEFQKAQETSADTSSIVAKKQALRDAPAAAGISTAATTDDLEAQWDTDILGTSPYN